jgi:hypothetical protein
VGGKSTEQWEVAGRSTAGRVGAIIYIYLPFELVIGATAASAVEGRSGWLEKSSTSKVYEAASGRRDPG